MELSKLRELIREEVSSSIIEKVYSLNIDPEEFLVFKLNGPFSRSQYENINQLLNERFGDRAIAIGSDKEYNIEIVKGKIKDGK